MAETLRPEQPYTVFFSYHEAGFGFVGDHNELNNGAARQRSSLAWVWRPRRRPRPLCCITEYKIPTPPLYAPLWWVRGSTSIPHLRYRALDAGGDAGGDGRPGCYIRVEGKRSW